MRAETPHARGVVAYGRALLAAQEDPPAVTEEFFAQALSGSVDRPFERARTHLAYGEFLRRSRRRVDAREQLRSALQIFHDLGAQPWVQRAEQELRASGETARKRDVSTSVTLTAQETAGRWLCRGRAFQPRGRREVVPQPPNHRLPSPECLRQDGYHLAQRTGEDHPRLGLCRQCMCIRVIPVARTVGIVR